MACPKNSYPGATALSKPLSAPTSSLLPPLQALSASTAFGNSLMTAAFDCFLNFEQKSAF